MTASTTIVIKEFSGDTRKLALIAVNSEDKAENGKMAFYASVLKDGILPSSLALYQSDAKAICLTTFPKKVQEGIASNLIRKDDLIKGVKSEKTGQPLKKVDWQNQVNRKVKRLLEGYTAYIARHHHKVEKEGTLQPIAVDANNRPVRLPKAEKAVEIKEIEFAYATQARYSNIKTPRTAEVEIAKLCTKLCDLLKANSAEAKKRFAELSTGRKTVQITASAKK